MGVKHSECEIAAPVLRDQRVKVNGHLRATCESMRTYYAVVNVENRRLGTYVSAENIAAAFAAATIKYKKRYPRFYVETIAVQEMADKHADEDASPVYAIGARAEYCVKTNRLRQ